MRLTIDKQTEYARELLKSFEQTLSTELVEAILNADQSDETGIGAQRERVVELKDKLSKSSDTRAKDLISLADNLVKKSVWIIGGDGWAYDIGYGGPAPLFGHGRNLHNLFFGNQRYFNTGGEATQATPCAASGKIRTGGTGQTTQNLREIIKS